MKLTIYLLILFGLILIIWLIMKILQLIKIDSL